MGKDLQLFGKEGSARFRHDHRYVIAPSAEIAIQHPVDIARVACAQARTGCQVPVCVDVPEAAIPGHASLGVDRQHRDGGAARGRGIGKTLLLSLIDAARDRGFWKLVSRVFPFNTSSRALCRSCGFREVGVYEKHAQLDGRWLDAVIVERLLHSGRPDPSV